jgi:hypothetical protein
MLRWIVRPLVAHQEFLTAEERAYWEPYLYQSRGSQPESYLDYLNLTGKPIASTWNEAAHTCIAIDGIDAAYRAGAAHLDAAAAKAKSPEVADALRLDAMRLRAKACTALTVRHTLQVGTLIYERDRDLVRAPRGGNVDPRVPDLPQGSEGSYGLFFMFRALRWELDNMNELISIVESARGPIIATASDKSREGTLTLGPDVLESMKRKVEITLRHWREAEKGYYLPTKGG